ncbi:MAG: RNA polymerase sigma factor [Opitutaceae bacterium]|nr:RNA polymerase sigma factor [Opitutaceae bacterium]
MPPPIRNSDDARWFAEHVLPHDAALRAYLRGRFPAMQDVEDVVQDSYLKILRRQSAGRISSAKTYLFTVARNTALKVFRKRQRISDVPVNELPEWRVLEGGPTVADATNTHLQDALIAEAIADLPARCREIFKLRVAGGLSHAEIAGRLGLSESTVRVQVARGLARCLRTLRESGIEAAP